VDSYGEQREIYSQKVRAGKRTYLFDVRATRNNDYYITITERKKNADGDVHKQKLFLYKEDFNKFLASLNNVVDHVKTELLPDYDYEQYDRPYDDNGYAADANYNGNYNNNADGGGERYDRQNEQPGRNPYGSGYPDSGK